MPAIYFDPGINGSLIKISYCNIILIAAYRSKPSETLT
jgi:hypothetical protein